LPTEESPIGKGGAKTSKALARASAPVVLFAVLIALLLGPSAAFAAATLSPSSWNFGNQAVGTSSTKTFTYENTDPITSVTVTGVSVTGTGFSKGTDNCTGTLAGGASCTVNVTFHPGSRGSASGSLTVTDDVNGPSSSSLSGTGISPGAALSPTSLSFSGLPVGSTSNAKAVTLTNNGNATLSISSTSASGDFHRTSNCGASLGAGASCTISVTFKPTAQGSRTGALTVTDNAGSGTQKVTLSGTGLAPSVKISPSSLTFEKQRKGTTSPAQSIKLSNVGKATLHITAVSASGDFSQASTCVGSVAVGGSCTISVTFHPTASGTRSGTLSVSGDAGSQHASLSGLGVFPAFSISGTKLRFPKTDLGASSSPKNIKITNPGTDRLYIQKLTLTGDFSQTNTCEPYVNPGITCTISVTFDPKRLQVRSGVLKIVHDLGSATVKVSGVGIAGIGPTTGPSRPEPTFEPAAAPSGPVEEVRHGSNVIRFLLGGGLFVLLAGLLLMFLSRGRGEEPEPALAVTDMGPEAADADAADDRLPLVAEDNEAGALDDQEAASVPLLSSLQAVSDTLPFAPWEEPADASHKGSADGRGNGTSAGRTAGASELETAVPEGREPV
jgi:archaellum component FlaF (FlaF/FlaG flagellin family)